MRLINVLLAVVVSLLIGVLVLEGGLRLTPYAPTKRLNQPHPTLGWSPKPDLRVERETDEYDVTFELNELGMRDDPRSTPAKPEGVFRVLCLGDSFTLGFSVDRDDLFVDLLERWWNAEGRQVEVINVGAEGYSTDQEALWLIENGGAWQPDLVLLFPYENDIYWNGSADYYEFQKPRFDPEGRLDHVGPFAPPEREGLDRRWAIANLWKRIFGPRETRHLFQLAGVNGPLLCEHAVLLTRPPGFATDASLRTRGALRALKEASDSLGARLVMAPIPSHAAIDPEHAKLFHDRFLRVGPDAWSPDLPVETFLDHARSLGIAALDARPALRRAQAAGTPQYFSDDWHFDPAGNRTFATFLHEELDRLGIFPPEHRATAEAALPPTPPAESVWPLRGAVFVGLWALLTALYRLTYRQEPLTRPALFIGLLLTLVFAIVLGGGELLALAPPLVARTVGLLFVLAILGFVLYKLGRRLETIVELLRSFTLRGHWYLMPLVIVLLTVGSLLVVAASSPLVAPFIYTLF